MHTTYNYHLLAAQQEPYKKHNERCFSFLGEMSGERTISRKWLRQKEQEEGAEKKKWGAYRKGESNDSTEILDRGVDIRHPWPSFGAFTCKLNQFTFTFHWNKPPKPREARKYAALVRSGYKCRSVQPNLSLYKYRSVKPNLLFYKYRSVKPNLPLYKYRSVKPNIPLYKYRSVKPNLPLYKYRSVKPNWPLYKYRSVKPNWPLYKYRSVKPNRPLYKYMSVKPNLPLYKYRAVKPNLVTDSTAASSAEHHAPGWGRMRMITFYPADSWAKSTHYQQMFPAWIFLKEGSFMALFFIISSVSCISFPFNHTS